MKIYSTVFIKLNCPLVKVNSFTVNNYHRSLKGWMQRFNGVATKYLNNYLAWFHMLESIQHQRNEVAMKDLIIKDNLIQDYDTIRLTKLPYKHYSYNYWIYVNILDTKKLSLNSMPVPRKMGWAKALDMEPPRA